MQNNKRVKVERRAVSLYPNDWSTVDGYGEILGISASAALRAIIRQWKRNQNAKNVRQHQAASESVAEES